MCSVMEMIWAKVAEDGKVFSYPFMECQIFGCAMCGGNVSYLEFNKQVRVLCT